MLSHAKNSWGELYLIHAQKHVLCELKVLLTLLSEDADQWLPLEILTNTERFCCCYCDMPCTKLVMNANLISFYTMTCTLWAIKGATGKDRPISIILSLFQSVMNCWVRWYKNVTYILKSKTSLPCKTNVQMYTTTAAVQNPLLTKYLRDSKFSFTLTAACV